MATEMFATKLIVRDVEASESFYSALGLKVVNHNVGGEAEFAQKQCWLSATGDKRAHMLVLAELLELPPPREPVYPGEVWLTFNVPDVDATCRAVEEAGGRILRPGRAQPEHGVRAAVVSDPEGHVIELVGPLSAS